MNLDITVLPEPLKTYKKQVMQHLKKAVLIPTETLTEFYNSGVSAESAANALETWPEFKHLHEQNSGLQYHQENDLVNLLSVDEVPIVLLHGEYQGRAIKIAQGRSSISKAEYHEIYNKVFNRS